MKSIAAYVGAAFLEIGGCFAVWAWLRLGASPWWLVPGLLALAAFAWLLTLIEVDAAGRAYGPMAASTSPQPWSGCWSRHAARPLGLTGVASVCRRRDHPVRPASPSP